MGCVPGGFAVIVALRTQVARRVPSPRIFGRGSQGAATDAAAWAGRKSETAARRACLHGVWGVWQASPPKWKRLEPFHLAYAVHRGDACESCVLGHCADFCPGRTHVSVGFVA